MFTLPFLRHPLFIEKSAAWGSHKGQWYVGYGWSVVCYTRFKVFAYIVLWLWAIYFVVVRRIKYGDPIFMRDL